MPNERRRTDSNSMPNGNEKASYRTYTSLWLHAPQQETKNTLQKPFPADVAHGTNDQDFYGEQKIAKKSNNGAQQDFKSNRKTGEYAQHT